jgi:uncharacterized protein YbbC (DUF1343 family)
MHLRLGSERLLDSPGCTALLDGKRVGVVCHPASVDCELRRTSWQGEDQTFMKVREQSLMY